MYFVGVTTHQSSINRVFPKWTKDLGVDVALRGMNFKVHDDPKSYRRAVEFIKNDPLSLGALVTTHKLDVLSASIDLFDELDEFAQVTQEVSSISKVDGKLVGHAKDPITCGRALSAFLPDNYWQETGAEALILGAGGSSVAMTWQLTQPSHGQNRPSRIIVTNRSVPRLDSMRQLHQQIKTDVEMNLVHTPNPKLADDLLSNLAPGSLVINATGLGKDAPGSPLTDAGDWPQDAIAWDFNYRGDLIFLDQARSQREAKNLQIEDGWIYFIHGWTSVMAEVLHVDIPSSGPQFDKLSQIAADVR